MMRVAGLAGWSGAGKTTLLAKLIPALIQRGISVSTIKHAHHDFDLDRPGKDSWRHREAGATEVMVTSSRRWALQHEGRGAPEADLETLVGHMTPVDLLLIEGFKRNPHPKLEVHRSELGKPLLYPSDPAIRGIAAVGAFVADPTSPPVIDADDVETIATFIMGIALPLQHQTAAAS
jgi:molybdopterin-guanine dinucleotide biosynthesis protein B